MQRLVYDRVSIKISNANLVVLASIIFRTLCYRFYAVGSGHRS